MNTNETTNKLNSTQAADAGGWRVEIDGVHVGGMPDSDYQAIRKRAHTNPTTYARQLHNVGTVVWCALNYVINAIPGILFWMLLAVALFEPNTLVQIRDAALSASQAELREAITKFVSLAACLGFGTLFLVTTFGGKSLGYINHFKEEIRASICREFKPSTDGQVVMKHYCKD